MVSSPANTRTHWMLAQGKRLRLAMLRKGLTQQQVAELLGVTHSAVSSCVAGRRPNRKHLPRLAAILDVPVEWITTGHPPQPWEAAVPVAGDAPR
jgi:transcriptional regulator with XRE-family HTH domain